MEPKERHQDTFSIAWKPESFSRAASWEETVEEEAATDARERWQ